MGGEVQEQRYVCKICSKVCVSGKSLGGHMRIHLAQISASKKAAQEKAEIKMEYDDDNDQDGSYLLQQNCVNQSNSDVAIASDGRVDFGDGDQSNNYELRENPKKSWRISDLKHGAMNSCKECGKEFASLRALSGHMRCHSTKNKKEVHHCKECGRGFDSIRAMFGHMKSHSKKLKIATVESAESLSDLENFCPIRRKRSRIRYKGTVNPSFLGVDASNSALFELEEAEEAAKCLVLLSRGAINCLKLDSITESSGDDSAYFGAVTYSRSKKFCGNGGDSLVDSDDKKWKSSLSTVKLPFDCFSSGYANAYAGKTVSEFDGLGLEFVAGDQTKDGLDVENGMNVDFVCDDGKLSVNTFLKYQQFDELKPADDSGTLVAIGNNEGDKSGFEKNSSEDEADLDMEYFEKPGYKHRACYKNIRSHRSSGSQTARHKLRTTNASLLSADSKLDQCGDDQLEELSKSKERECPICFKIFPSGQALGGHKRAHYNGVAESKNREAMPVNQDVTEDQQMLDLNFPISVDAGTQLVVC